MDNVKQLPQNVSVNSTELNPDIDLKPHVYVACCLSCRYFDPYVSICTHHSVNFINNPDDLVSLPYSPIEPWIDLCDDYSPMEFVEGGLV